MGFQQSQITMHYGGIEDILTNFLEQTTASVLTELGVHEIPPREIKAELEIPKENAHGDLATNIAMRVCKFAKMPALSFASLIKDKMEAVFASSRLKGAIDRIETKAPGFINFFLSKYYLYKVLLEIKRRRGAFGRATSIGRGLKLQIEFVSANPTGPLTIAHGRQAAIGDSLANILEHLGYKVTREYYINDEGVQMDILANSIRIRYLGLFGIKEDFPQDGYKGHYIIDIASAFKDKYGRRFLGEKDLKVFREFGLNWILRDIKKDLKAFGVNFDVWYSQRALRGSGRVEKALEFLKKRGHTYEKDGAVWFRSSALGDDKDRVLIKSDGNVTYLAPDIAYHLDKYRRGFKKVIDIWGPDHHGYVPRMKAAIEALGRDPDSLSVIIVQLATLYKGGQIVSMSTRSGEFVTLREVMDEVGKDVARFCFISRRVSSHLAFDVDTVKKESLENPVYYIQYAHARICSILEHSKKLQGSRARFDCRLLKEEEELDILRILRQFPLIVALSGKSQEPYIIMQYLQDVATVFHSFYTKHRVISDCVHLSQSRLVLVDCVRIVIANGLRLLGVSLPRKM